MFTKDKEDLAHPNPEELDAPLIDLDGLIINHGVDASLIQAAHQEIDVVFKLPLDKKLSISQKPGSFTGYSSAHSHRFPSNLPWNELFSFLYSHDKSSEEAEVVNYFKSIIGKTMHYLMENTKARAVVNTEKERRSLVFFVSPKENKVVRPPQDLVCREDQHRKYPDFIWSDMMQYTQKHHRVDGNGTEPIGLVPVGDPRTCGKEPEGVAFGNAISGGREVAEVAFVAESISCAKEPKVALTACEIGYLC
ncbi:hypothetical protein JRO89_XS11G0076500 [Xanthoceras sorbifolium]|uniref:Non-haem dioxygenase N-terminal domain-containing protein n=1 Tax=Xanthoceras sorbifolium TaxID=99658 RepID=A0ABQ8HF42_9ROSI|nr:hypothetical protein JRO89_XS11G0076500 [Xanthoceras sorbifolium]